MMCFCRTSSSSYLVSSRHRVIMSSSCCLSATRVGAYAVLSVLPSVVCQLYLTSRILRQMHVLPPMVEVCNQSQDDSNETVI